MGLVEISMIGVGLAMDAFAVAVGKGLSLKKMQWKIAIIIGLYFGVFQAIMPLGGYLSGKVVGNIINRFSGFITFGLLCFIGVKMIKETFWSEGKENNNINFNSMIILAIATSIDAFAVGITFAFYDINILIAILIIGIITFCLCLIGVKLGNVFGYRYEKGAQILGGIILIVIGIKALLERTGIF